MIQGKFYEHIEGFIDSVRHSKDPASTAFTYIAALYLNLNLTIDEVSTWISTQTPDDWVRILFSIGLIYVGHKAFKPREEEPILLKDKVE